jgi:hypothetical protein
MKDLRTLDIVFECGYGVQIGRLYQPILDGILVVGSLVNKAGLTLLISQWETGQVADTMTKQILPSNLSFQFKCHGFSANQMNTLWRDLTKSLETVDKHWTVVYTDNKVECSYDINKELV